MLQILLNVKVKHKPDLNQIPDIQQAIKTAEATLNGSGRVLVRYSGTEALFADHGRGRTGFHDSRGRRSSREYCACPHRLATASCRRCRMLPTLTITFILGLALGSYVSSFPLSSAILLTICTVGALLVERQKRFSPRQTSLWLACFCGGCVYWILYAWLAPHSPVPERPGGFADPRHWNNRGLRSSCPGGRPRWCA